MKKLFSRSLIFFFFLSALIFNASRSFACADSEVCVEDGQVLFPVDAQLEQDIEASYGVVLWVGNVDTNGYDMEISDSIIMIYGSRFNITGGSEFIGDISFAEHAFFKNYGSATVNLLDGSIFNGSLISLDDEYEGIVNISSNSTLYLDSSTLNTLTNSVSAESKGDIVINANQTVTAATEIGATYGLNNVTLSSGSSLSIGAYDLNTDSISLGVSSILNTNGGDINTSISGSGAINLGDGSILSLNDSSSSTSIDGVAAGYGDLVINTDQTVSTAGIGSNYSLNSVTLNSGSSLTVGEYDVAATNLAIAENATAQFSGDITGDISFSGTLNLAKTTATEGFDPNSLGFTSNQSFTGNIITGDVIGSGILNLNSGTHFVDGNLTLQSGSILVINAINSDKISSISVNGSASVINTSLQLSLNGITLTRGSSYEIISAVDGSGLNKIIDSNISVNGSNNIVGNATYSTSVLNNSLFLDVSELPDDSAEDEIAALPANLSPSAFSATKNSVNIPLDRLSSMISHRGFSSGDGLFNQSIWGQVFGSKVDQGNSALIQGYNSRTYGFTFGADKEIGEDVMAGISISYSDSKIDSKDRANRTQLDSYQINLYAGREFDNLFFANAILGVAFNEYDSSRKTDTSSISANSKYSGETFIGKIEFGKRFNLQNNIILMPTLSITAAKNKIDSYVEEGAGDLNLQVTNKNTNFFEARFGIRAGKEMIVSKTQRIHPSIHASYGYDLAGNKLRATARFVGQSADFTSSSGNIAQSSVKLGTSLKILYLNSFTMELDYTVDHRKKYNAHSGSLKVKYEF